MFRVRVLVLVAGWLALGPAAALAKQASPAPLVAGNERWQYRVVGDGPETVVLIPASFGNHRQWDTMLPHLQKELGPAYRFVVLDYPGVGRSKDLRPPVFEDGLAYGRQQVLAVLKDLKVGRAHLFGYSLGALVAQEVAGRHPERVKSVFMLGAPYCDEATLPKVNAAYEPLVKALDRLRPRWNETITKANFREVLTALAFGQRDGVEPSGLQRLAVGLAAPLIGKLFWGSKIWSIGMLAEEYVKRPEQLQAKIRHYHGSLRRIPRDLPVAVARGQFDQLVSTEMTRSLTSAIPQARVFRVPLVDHVAPSLLGYAGRMVARRYVAWQKELRSAARP
ncbi:MAG: alpha/beta fold hydrolase [Deltaproteobacteria bacterium]|nr:alpha/beta fold hydrolase [Deltaproteobacteria bacterium]